MSGGGWGNALSGVLGGFQGESSKIRDQETKLASDKAARDNKVFEALANADDPEIRAAAVTGLLTDNHPANGLDKWFGKVREHPAFQTISSLINDEGHQPFMSAEDREAGVRKGHIMGTVAGATGAYTKATGEQPSKEFVERVVGGAAGAPQRIYPATPGTAIIDDPDNPGKTKTVGAHDYMGTYYDENWNPLTGVRQFIRGGNISGSGASSGGSWQKVQDSTSPTGWTAVHVDATGKELGRQQGIPAPSEPPAITSSVPSATSPSGIAGVTRKGEVRDLPREAPKAGGAPTSTSPVVHPSTPTEDLQGLRELEASILRLHPQPKPLFAGGSINPQKMQKWRTEVDAEAKHYGYPDYAALQAKIGTASGTVGSRTTPGGPPPVPEMSTTPTPAPAGKPKGNAPPPTKPERQKGSIDSKAVLDYLKKFDQPPQQP